MLLFFFLIWVIFNGQITLEIAIFGIVIASLMYMFFCKFFDYSPRKDILLVKRSLLLLQYLFVLILEILKANICVFQIIYGAKSDPEPALIQFTTNLNSNFARVLLANSITLTPGTITVSLENNEYTVHCLDKELAHDIDRSVFVKLLERIEKVQ